MKVLNLLTACAIAAPLLFVSCNSDDTLTAPGSDADGVRITFTLGVSAGPADVASRADDGEFYDEGLSGERQVNNAMIVVYDRPINSNLPIISDLKKDSGNIVKVFYFDDLAQFTPSDIPTEATYFDPMPAYYPQSDVLTPIKVGDVGITDTYKQSIKVGNADADKFEVGKRYYAIALCNFGNTLDDKSTTDIEAMTLMKFRDYVYKGALYTQTGNIKKYNNFRMTGINETSFIWQRNTQGSVSLGDFLVQRLAARVDVTFGDPQTEFINQETYYKEGGTGDGYIQLAVYTPNAEGKYVIDTSKNFYFKLTDLQIVNDVTSGTYLIERSSPHAPIYKDEAGNKPVPVYLDNEGWLSYTDFVNRRASKYIFPPLSSDNNNLNVFDKDGYSLAYSAGYKDEDGNPDMCKLIKDGVFYNDKNEDGTDPGYYDNKKKSSVVGYIHENTCSDYNYTVLRIAGWTNASADGHFTGGSRALDTTGLTYVVGDIPILHNTNAKEHVMEYAVVRNTIYRMRLKVLASENKIYFRYYYILPDGSISQRPYDVTCFSETVSNYDPNKHETIYD